MPVLTVIAGPNGAGKTRHSPFLKSKGFITTDPINIDQIKKQLDETVLSFDFLRIEEQRLKEVNRIFLAEAQNAINNQEDFSYESNLSTGAQIQPISLFYKAGYKINLIYILLDTIDKSKKRVKKRSQIEKGHFVSKENIQINFYEGLKNLDGSFEDWDRLFIADGSAELTDSKDEFEILLIAEQGKIIFYNRQPNKDLHPFLPNIMNTIKPLG